MDEILNNEDLSNELNLMKEFIGGNLDIKKMTDQELLDCVSITAKTHLHKPFGMESEAVIRLNLLTMVGFATEYCMRADKRKAGNE